MAGLSRRELLRLVADLSGLGLCGCATLGNGTAAGGRSSAGAAPLPAGSRYSGPLVDCHSHVIGRTPPGSGVTGLSETELVDALGSAGVDVVVGFGASPGLHGGRLVPVYSFVGGAPARAEVRAWLADGRYRGLKTVVRHFPFPMNPRGVSGRADTAPMQEVAAVAAETKAPLTVHCDGPDVDDLDRLCAAVPEAPIVWAHAGTTPPQYGGGATPATIQRMLARHPNLHVDLSARAPGWMGPLAPLTPGQPLLPPEWETILTQHASRVLFGIDIFVTRFLPAVPGAVAYWRRLLGELPEPVAAKIAHENARRLYRL